MPPLGGRGQRAPPVPQAPGGCPLPSLQEMVYQATTKSLIKGVISGYNATVFAYGPTGEGGPHSAVGARMLVPLEEQAPSPSVREPVWPQLGQDSRM